MRRIVVTSNVTLDGVTQAPGRPDEDVRGGFEHGGWALPYDDEIKAEAMGRGMARPARCCSGDGRTKISSACGRTVRTTRSPSF